MRWVILIAAILVWINVYAFIDRTVTVSAPLLIKNLSENLAIAEPLTVVDATVIGGIRDTARLSGETLQFSLDASEVTTPGRYTLEIQPELLPESIKLVSFAPQQIQVTAEAIASKSVPVTALSQGVPNDKYSINALIAVPSEVLVFGAPSLLAQISEARAYVDVSRRRESFTVPAAATMQDAKNRTISSLRVAPATVKVNVEMIAGASIRNLGLQPAFSGELPGGFWVQEVKFEPMVVQVRGPHKILGNLTSLFSTPINLTDRRGSFNEQVAVNLPSGAELVGENLVMAQVAIGSSEGTRQLDIVPQYVNVTEGFGVTATNPASIQVVISGDPKTINQLKRSDVGLNLDLKGTLSGTNQITITPAMFILPPNIQIVSFTPATMEVILSRL